MPAFLITIRKGPIQDADAMAEYQRRTRAMKASSKMTPKVVYGAVKCLEGGAPDGVVVLARTGFSLEGGLIITGEDAVT